MKNYKAKSYSFMAFQLNYQSRLDYPELCKHVTVSGARHMNELYYDTPKDGDYIITDYLASGKMRTSFLTKEEFEAGYEEVV